MSTVIAWRLAALVLLGRSTPELPAEVMFSECEIAALKDFATDGRKRPEPTDLGTAMLALAMLGGYLNRKRDGPPGMKTVWTGHMRLAAAQAYERLIRAGTRIELSKKLRPD